MKLATVVTISIFGTVLLNGCAGLSVTRQAALKLQAQVGTYQNQIDDQIKVQRDFQEKKIAQLEQSRANSLLSSIEELRRERATDISSRMAGDPMTEARMATLTGFLIDMNTAEYELYVKLYAQQNGTRSELEAIIHKLERKRQALDNVKASLADLADGKTNRAQAKQILDLAADTITKLSASPVCFDGSFWKLCARPSMPENYSSSLHRNRCATGTPSFGFWTG